MTVYKKFKLGFFAVLASQSLYAISIHPIQIQSAPGELLYAELSFSNADPHENIQASLASAEELMSIGAQHQPPDYLNFYTRKNTRGEGVITITSSRPMTANELNLVIKIKNGNASRLQHIRSTLKPSGTTTAQHTQPKLSKHEQALRPIMIVSEKEIALNLAVSQHYQAQNNAGTANTLKISNAAPPPLRTQQASLSPAINVQSASAHQAKPTRIAPATDKLAITQAPPVAEKPTAESLAIAPTDAVKAQQQIVESATANSSAVAKSKAMMTAEKPATAVQTVAMSQHVVKANESLWKIAERVATQQKRPIAEVMQQIKRDNAHAFIQGDANRLRNGSILKLTVQDKNPEHSKRQIAEWAKSSSPPSGKTKYRLNQAQMSLISENGQDSVHGSAKTAVLAKKTSKELSSKVITTRKKTVDLQKNVTQLELALNQKAHRIQLLNARLAQLQQQLQAQQVQKNRSTN